MTCCRVSNGKKTESIGLFVFALVVWQFMPRDRAWIVLAGATLLWLGVSVTVWQIRKRLRTKAKRWHPPLLDPFVVSAMSTTRIAFIVAKHSCS